jgi:three-Cys-motif partner protein
MWILFPSQGLIRVLGLKGEPTDLQVSHATRLFGTDAWRVIHRMRRSDEIDGAAARESYLNLMRWRLENELGYEWTHPLEVKNLRGGPLYHMILATDNKAGTKIISDLYTRAANRLPMMRQEILERVRAVERPRLMDVPIELPKRLYEYEPPTEPPV